MEKKELAPFGVPGYYDRHLYGGADSKYAGYLTSIPASDEEDDKDDIVSLSRSKPKTPSVFTINSTI
jgi:hypothetical protein